MAVGVGIHAAYFAEQLNIKHAEYGEFKVLPGKRYDKIVVTPHRSTQTFVHAFVECETGHVFKPAGWKAPAKGVRYARVIDAVRASDPFGGYLYVR